MNIKEFLQENNISFVEDKNGALWIEIDKEKVKEFLEKLKSIGFDFLTCISGVDTGDGKISIIYHVTSIEDYKTLINVKTTLSKDKLEIDSVYEIFNSAEIYEREIYDLLGVKFVGHPNLKRILLPEDLPEDYHPLRKE